MHPRLKDAAEPPMAEVTALSRPGQTPQAAALAAAAPSPRRLRRSGAGLFELGSGPALLVERQPELCRSRRSCPPCSEPGEQSSERRDERRPQLLRHRNLVAQLLEDLDGDLLGVGLDDDRALQAGGRVGSSRARLSARSASLVMHEHAVLDAEDDAGRRRRWPGRRGPRRAFGRTRLTSSRPRPSARVGSASATFSSVRFEGRRVLGLDAHAELALERDAGRDVAGELVEDVLLHVHVEAPLESGSWRRRSRRSRTATTAWATVSTKPTICPMSRTPMPISPGRSTIGGGLGARGDRQVGVGEARPGRCGS